jgi:hypothetical protein
MRKKAWGMNIEDWLSSAAIGWIAIGAVTAVLFLSIGVMRLSVKLTKLRKQYLKSMGGGSVDNVEQLLMQMNERLDVVLAENKQQKDRLSVAEAALKKMKSNIGILRYNAFGDRGSDQSFSVAIVNDSLDGVILTGIHTRDETYMYAKPLEKGQSSYSLSPEEKEAINRSSDN